MSKLVLVAAVVAALMAVAVVAEGREAAVTYYPFAHTETQCQGELEESTLEACQKVMHYVVHKVPGQELPGSLGWSPWVHARCCQQLLKIRRDCRDAAIRRLVRKYEVPREEGSGESGEPQLEHGRYGQTTGHQHQQRQGEGFQDEPTGHGQQKEEGHRHTAVGRRGQQPEAGRASGETVRQEEGEGYGLPSPPRFSTEQEAAHRRLMKARQFAAKLPVMCRYETAQGRGSSSADLY